LGLTQRQLTLLRKVVEVSSAIPEGESIEFIVSVTHSEGTSLFFIGTRSRGIEKVSQSDLNELKRSGYVLTTGYNSQGTEILQAVNEAFELFRDEAVAEFPPSGFSTGDPGLDELLDTAITKYKLHDVREQKDALEKIWDAWERLKTLETGDKKSGAKALLDKAASEPTFRSILEDESRILNNIGNGFRIRHHETGKIDLSDPHQVDYLFERMLSIIRLLLRKSGRM
jgi:hypothetical protein